MTKIKIIGKELELDQSILQFNEHSINQFLQTFASLYVVYQEAHADAQYVNSKYEDKYDHLYADKFRVLRQDCSSDKMADMMTKSDPELQQAMENMRASKRTVNLLYGFLKSMDKAYDSAVQYSYNLRKEMEKLHK